jgi:hypothetical protein
MHAPFSQVAGHRHTNEAHQTRRDALTNLARLTLTALGSSVFGLPALAAEVWVSGITRGRTTEFATQALSNLPEKSVRAASPRMVQLNWTFDPVKLPDAAELRRVQDQILAHAQAQLDAQGGAQASSKSGSPQSGSQIGTPGKLHLVATGRAAESAFWCLYVPASFKTADVTEALAGFDSLDQAMALRLRNRLGWLQRNDPGWTWAEAYLREMARK